MIPRIAEIRPLDNFLLYVRFDDGREVDYDVMEDISTIPSFKDLMSERGLFNNLQLDASRTCVTWSENIDLPSDSIYEYGKVRNKHN